MTAAPVSLYIKLEEGKTADLEVVARASLAFAAAIKELAFKLDPSAEVRIELVSGTEGSLFLNSIIRTLRDKAKEKPLAFLIAATVLGWFGAYTFNEIMDELRDARVEISDEQIDEIARRAAEYVERGEARPQVADVYREISQDPAIEGAGASLRPSQKPRHIVPRSEFPERISESDFALRPPEIDLPERRTRRRRQTVIVISPVLLHGERRWKLRSHEGEFGASIKDARFLDDVLSGKRAFPTVEGVQMDAIIETTDVWTGHAWQPSDHVVLQVFEVTPPAMQTELVLVAPKEKKKSNPKGGSGGKK